MLNTSVFFEGGVTNNNIKVNAITGGIVKNHKDSYFRRFNLNSPLADTFLSDEPHRFRDMTFEERRENNGYRGKIKVYVEILQLVLVGEMEVVAEVIDLPAKVEDDTIKW